MDAPFPANPAKAPSSFPKLPLIVGAVVALLFLFLKTGMRSVEREGWTDNQSQALANAQKENKLLLMDFTGSDWCEGCIRLDKEVFSTPEFKRYAAGKLVLVEVDFPHRKYVSPEIKEQNARLQQDYNVEGFPTVVILSPAGKELARFNYQDGGPKVLINALEKLPKT